MSDRRTYICLNLCIKLYTRVSTEILLCVMDIHRSDTCMFTHVCSKYAYMTLGNVVYLKFSSKLYIHHEDVTCNKSNK